MFRFKQFIVHDDRCAMKVGTDGVLLGAWVANWLENISGNETTVAHGQETPLEGRSGCVRILDIGTGSGLIALMLAQKYHSQNTRLSAEDISNTYRTLTEHIDAIDIDPDAVAQAKENFLNSPFSSILHAHLSSLQDWVTPSSLIPHPSSFTPHPSSLTPHPYNLIVSNPPYFVDSLKNPDLSRQTARHTDTLSFQDLISCSSSLLCEGGHLALILPAQTESSILGIAASHDLYPVQICHVHGSARKPAKRVMLLLRKQSLISHPSPLLPQSANLILTDENGARSVAYATLCQDYYL